MRAEDPWTCGLPDDEEYRDAEGDDEADAEGRGHRGIVEYCGRSGFIDYVAAVVVGSVFSGSGSPSPTSMPVAVRSSCDCLTMIFRCLTSSSMARNRPIISLFDLPSKIEANEIVAASRGVLPGA